MSIKDIKRKTENLTLLYVEDNQDLKDVKMVLFKEIFKSVQDASNGYEGLKMYQEDNYDLIITDINMPIMNGIEMIKKIKKINPEQKVIIHSAYAELEYYTDIAELNVNCFVTKPVNTKIFIEKIDDAISEVELA